MGHEFSYIGVGRSHATAIDNLQSNLILAGYYITPVGDGQLEIGGYGYYHIICKQKIMRATDIIYEASLKYITPPPTSHDN